MAAARIVALADEPAPPETADVVRRQRQLLRRAAALCLDPHRRGDRRHGRRPDHLRLPFRGRQVLGLQLRPSRRPEGLNCKTFDTCLILGCPRSEAR